MESVETGYSEPLLQSENKAQKATRRTLIFACSGISNTGKLTMQAASALAFRRPDMYRAAAAHKGVASVEDAVADGFRILVIDGCIDCCATKKLDEAGLKSDIHIMITDLGIKKTIPSDVKPEYIEKNYTCNKRYLKYFCCFSLITFL